MRPDSNVDSFGLEDPRIAFNEADGLYYIFYTEVTNKSGNAVAHLSLATCKDPMDGHTYQIYGRLWNNDAWSKSGALLIQPQAPHYLFFGDSGVVNGLQVAITKDLYNYTLMNNGQVWLPMRNNSFDSALGMILVVVC